MRGIKLLAVFAVLLGSTAAASALDRPFGRSGDYQSGETAAQLGTRTYNYFNPSTPLPVSSGNVVQKTIYNMGAGQRPAAAFSNASAASAGIKRR